MTLWVTSSARWRMPDWAGGPVWVMLCRFLACGHQRCLTILYRCKMCGLIPTDDFMSFLTRKKELVRSNKSRLRCCWVSKVVRRSRACFIRLSIHHRETASRDRGRDYGPHFARRRRELPQGVTSVQGVCPSKVPHTGRADCPLEGME